MGGECRACSKWQEPLPCGRTLRSRRQPQQPRWLGRDGFKAGSSSRAGALCHEGQARCGWATNREGTEPWSGVRHPPGHQHCDSQRYFPLNSLPFTCSLVFLKTCQCPLHPVAGSWRLKPSPSPWQHYEEKSASALHAPCNFNALSVSKDTKNNQSDTIPRCGAGCTRALRQPTPVPQPGKVQRLQHTGEPEHPNPQADVPGPRRFYIPAPLAIELLITAEINCTQVEPCKCTLPKRPETSYLLKTVTGHTPG